MVGEEELSSVLILGATDKVQILPIANATVSNGDSSDLKPLPSASSSHPELNLEKSDLNDLNDLNPKSEESPFLSELSLLSDFVRFDIIRTGIPCCWGYKVSVQYEEDFLLAQSPWPCLPSCCSLSSHKALLFSHSQSSSSLFLIHFPSSLLTLCFKRNRRKFTLCLHQGPEVGYVETGRDLTLTMTLKDKIFKTRKIRPNHFVIEDSALVKVGTVDIYRGLRGGISSYGVSILDDSLSAVGRALFISCVVGMDVDEREAEVRCSCFWAPVIASVVIVLFTILPWLYYQAQST